MKLLHKILLAVDFGPSTYQLVERVINLAKTFDSEIFILHVLPQMDLSKLNKEMIEKGVQGELEKIEEKISSNGIKVNTLKLNYNIAFVNIIDEADKNDVNVIVMGTGDKGISSGRTTNIIGVTAEKVLHKSAKPVWTVHPQNSSDINTILCPVDFSKPAERALTNAIHLSRQMNAKLNILNVVPKITSLYKNFLGVSEQEESKQAVKNEKKLNDYLKNFDFHDVDYQAIIEIGNVYDVILNTAKSKSVDLLIMGASGESKSPKVLMGKNTEHILRELPCSIVTVKSESVIQPHIDYQIEDLESHYNLGNEFLKNGMPREAIEQFQYCIDKDVLFAPAWEGLAQSHERIDEEAIAKEFYKKAKSIREKFWEQQVQSEIRNQKKSF